MSQRDGIATGFGRGMLAGGATLALIAGLALSAPAGAQDKKDAPAPAAKKEAPAGKDAPKDAKAAPAGKQSAWVKLCEKSPLVHKDKDGKEVKEEKNICLTHHERLDGNSGMVLVSAAIRQVEGSEHDHLMIMVPLGMALPPGLKAAVYTKEQWEKAAKNEQVDDKELKPVDLKYSLCHSSGCTAEIEATKDIIDQMKAGGGIMVLAMNAQAQPIGFPVPLDGFTDAFAGKPVDNAEYKKARGQLMAQIRQKQQEAYEKFRAEKMKELPPPPGGDAPAAAPAAKK
ncbi:MAG: invasion associated locus B family protein [Hyphomicrobium sp.]|jgi:invasion protein IalB|uniref:invasion associated locus B family protein n=1 Tax=Hyphomicrobium sp. TaxID=82 RepID=UPI0025BCFA5E|nr:invasion associated locus B family protein [Hyphomicrobium sp.]MBX9862995.1 invasion associated locus B family protein [Hyphomicrobium sp.]